MGVIKATAISGLTAGGLGFGLSKNKTDYDTSTAVKSNGKRFNMSRLYRSQANNGRYVYRTADGTVVSDASGKLTKDAWTYLASKYGKDYANRTSANMMAGNIWQNGKWRENYAASGNKTADWATATKGKNMKTFNYKFGTGIKNLKYDGTKGRVSSEAQKDEWDDENTAFGNAAQWLARRAGLKLSTGAASAIEMGAYLIPGVGTAISAANAIDDIRKGDYWGAAMNAAFAIPGIGMVGKALKGASGLTKIGKLTSQYARHATNLANRATKLKIASQSMNGVQKARTMQRAAAMQQKAALHATKARRLAQVQNRTTAATVGNGMQRVANSSMAKYAQRAAGIGFGAQLAHTGYTALKPMVKGWYYGDKYTPEMALQDQLNSMDNQEQKDTYVNDMYTTAYANNNFGYGYDA